MIINSLLVKLGFSTDAAPLEKVQEHLEGIEHKLSFLAGAEILRGLFEIGERFAGMGEALETAAISAGITTEAFQKLSFAASQNAVGQDELSAGLARLNRNLYDARKGGESAIKAFADVGISPEQIASFHTSSDALKALSDKLVAIKDPVQRQAAAVELLGRGSFKMVKFLGQGSEAINKLGDSAEAMGAVLTGKQVESLATLEDTLSALFQIIKTVSAAIAADFAPTIIDIVHDIEEFYKANQQLIRFNIESWLDSIAYGLGYLSSIFISITRVVFDFIRAHPVLVKNIGKVVLAMMAISAVSSIASGALGLVIKWFTNLTGVVKLGMQALSVFRTVGGGALTAVTKAFVVLQGALVGVIEFLAAALAGVFPAFSAWLTSVATLLTATPIGVFAAALAAVVLAGQALYTYLTGGNVEDMWIVQLLNKIMAIPQALKGVYQSLKGRFFGRTEPAAPEAAAGGIDFAGDSGGIGGALDLGAQGMSTAQAMTQPSVALPGNTLDFAAESGGGRQMYTLNAPVTINTASGLSPDLAYKAVQEAAGEHFDRQVRDLMRSQQTAVVH